MAPKGQSSSLSPSAILADAANAFTKAATLAVAAAEEQAKLEVAQVQNELAELRREREKNLKTLNQTQLHEKDWERHADMLNTSLEKSEMRIKHQEETIVQLKSDVAQWKSQFERLEETSRREIQDWKDQYLRAEQERSRLSTRVDELIAEQLQTLPKAPPYRASETLDLTASRRPTITARKSFPTFPSDLDEPPTQPQKSKLKAKSTDKANSSGDRERTFVEETPTREAAQSSKRPTKAKPVVELPPLASVSPKKPSARKPAAAPRQPISNVVHQGVGQSLPRVFRRVHAVIDVPVKEEDYSEEEALRSEGSEYERPQQQASTRPKRKSAVKATSYLESEYESSDGGDDLLITGDNQDEVYGPQRVIVAGEVDSVRRPLDRARMKKRKLDADVAQNRSAAVGSKKKRT